MKIEGYVIVDEWAHTCVTFVRAASEEEALAAYVREQHGYVRRPDGWYWHKGEEHETLDDACSTHGLAQDADGTWVDTKGARYASRAEALVPYNVFPLEDGRFVSHWRAYPDVYAILAADHPGTRYHFGQAEFDTEKPIQTLFCSPEPEAELHWDAEAEIPYIAWIHSDQADRYERRGDIANAAIECERALGLPLDQHDRHGFLWRAAGLYTKLGRFDDALAALHEALRLSIPCDDRARMYMELARLCENVGDPERAVEYYQGAFTDEEDMLDEWREEALARIAALTG